MAATFMNAEVDVLNATLDQLADDISGLSTPLQAIPSGITALKAAALAAYATDTASGSIANFPDGADGIPVKSATFAIDPIQNLNGYDSPWPAGGGANLMEYPEVSTTYHGVTFKTQNGKLIVSGTSDGYNVQPYNASTVTTYETMRFGPYPAGTYTVKSTFPSVSNGTRNTIQFKYADGTSISLPSAFAATPQTFTATAPFKCDVWVNIASGDTVSFTAELVLNKGSEIQTWTPYSNICPISGWSGAEVTRAGKNLLNHIAPQTITNQGVTVTIAEDGTATVNGTYTGSAFSPVYYYRNLILPSGNYVINGWPAGSSGQVTLQLFNATTNTQVFNITDSGDHVFNSNGIDVYEVRIGLRASLVANNFVFKPMVRVSTETDTAYEPYTATTIPIEWSEAGTVYGGTLEYLGGEKWRLTRTHRYFSDISTYSVTSTQDYWFRLTLTADTRKGIPITEVIDGWCSHYKASSRNGLNTADMAFGISDTGSTFFIKDSRFTMSQLLDFKAALSGCELVIPLITPTTYDLTADELTTLLGSNNVWSDTGDSTVEYRADTALYIAKKIAEAQG